MWVYRPRNSTPATSYYLQSELLRIGFGLEAARATRDTLFTFALGENVRPVGDVPSVSLCPSLGYKIGIAGETEMMIDISTGGVPMHGAALRVTQLETTRTGDWEKSGACLPTENRPRCRPPRAMLSQGFTAGSLNPFQPKGRVATAEIDKWLDEIR